MQFGGEIPDAAVRQAAGTDALATQVQQLQAGFIELAESVASIAESTARSIAALEQRVTALEAGDPVEPPIDPPVEPPVEPPPVGLYVRSRWLNGSDVRDGGIWPRTYCGAAALRTVSGSARGFTRGNMLEIMQGGASLCGNVELDVPRATSHWTRAYVEWLPGHASMHGWSYPCTGNPIQVVPIAFQSGQLKVGMPRDQNNAQQPEPTRFGFFWRPPALPMKLRVEWYLEYVNVPGSAEGKVRIWPAISQGWEDDAPVIATAAHFFDTHWNASQRRSLQQFQASGGALGLTSVGAASAFALGQEGNAQASPGGSLFVGDFAIALDGPVGIR